MWSATIMNAITLINTMQCGKMKSVIMMGGIMLNDITLSITIDCVTINNAIMLNGIMLSVNMHCGIM